MASSLCGPAELPAASLEAGNPTGGRGLKLFFGLGLIEQCPMPARLRVGRRQEGLVADAKCQSVFLPASPRKEHRITQLGETLELLLQLHLQCQPGRWDGGGGGCGPALIHRLRCVCVHVSDNPAQVSRTVLRIRILDVNDNPPELALPYEAAICEDAKPGEVRRVGAHTWGGAEPGAGLALLALLVQVEGVGRPSALCCLPQWPSRPPPAADPDHQRHGQG